MRVGRSRRTGHAKDLDNPYSTDYLTDALTQLQGWTREGREFRRTLHLDETQHAALAERMKAIREESVQSMQRITDSLAEVMRKIDRRVT
jgi:hypothetical protein